MTDNLLVGEVMTREVLMVGPGHTLREVAKVLSSRRVGSAVVHDTDGAGIGIITERDILRSVAADEDLDAETAGSHQTSEVVFAAPTWTLTEAADAMKRGGFRHLVVLDGGEVAGVISVRDIVKAWTPEH
ncbi:MAG TPA: CBS domain-containing protein [Candidatus Nanopelagicales bacterium]|nr:CBS domain-containing protein [Candidatus Nanopelagicales bacterium]